MVAAEPPSVAVAVETIVARFRKYDVAGSGTIRRDHLLALLEHLGVLADVEPCLSALGFPDTGSGVDYEAFVRSIFSLAACDLDEPDSISACCNRQCFALEGKPDSRWDAAGFGAWCDAVEIGWVRASYLRSLACQSVLLPRRQELPDGALHVGAPPGGAQLYVVNYSWATPPHPDPEGTMLQRLVAILDRDRAFDSALVYLDWCSNFQAPCSEREQQLCVEQAIGSFRLHAFFRCKCAVIIGASKRADGTKFFEHAWPLAMFSISAFSQQILPKDDPDVQGHLTPEWVMDTEHLISCSASVPWGAPDMHNVQQIRRLLGASMVPAVSDALGFQAACRHANYSWVLVSFVHELAARGGPAPRRQDLPPDAHIDGVVPSGCQPWVVSYGWSAAFHFSPGGAKICELSHALKDLDAKPSDVVFLDYLSMWQPGNEVPAVYASINKDAVVRERSADGLKVQQPGMSLERKAERSYASREITRLYAFRGGTLPSGEPVLGCKVIVLPKLEDPHSFPDCGEIAMELNSFCRPPRKELNSAWGFAKSIPYERGGWTCTEYVVARCNGTIANAHHEDVQRIDGARVWPRDVRGFAEMMDEGAALPIAFTRHGDREYARFNFYKFTHHILDTGKVS